MMTNVGMFDDAIKMEKQARKIKELKKQLREVEGELSIIKGINFGSEEAKKIKRLKERVKDLFEINKEHQKMNGKMHSEIEILKKNETLLREDIQLKDIELGRLINKLSKKNHNHL